MPLTSQQELEMLQLMDTEGGLKSPRKASFGEKVGEVGRSFGRGVQMLGEFGGDVYDVAKAALTPEVGRSRAFYGADTGMGPTRAGAVGQELNPFGAPGPGDIAREEFYGSPLVKTLTQEKLKRGESTGLDVLKTGAEWAPSLINPTQSLTRNVATILTGSFGAGAGEQLGGDVGEVVGGIVGALSGNRTGEAFKRMRDWLVDRKGLIAKKAEDTAIKFFRDNASDINQSIANVTENVQAGQRGTTAQLAGDTGLFGIEAGANVSPAAIDAQRVARQGRTEQIIEDVGGAFGPKLPAAQRALPQARQQLGQQVTGSEKRLSQAVAAEADAVRVAETQTRQVTPQSQTFEASQELARVLDTSQETYNKLYKAPAWAEFDALRGKAGAIETAPFKTRMENFRKSLSATERNVFDVSYGKEMDYIRDLNKTARPSEIAFLVSRFKTITGNAARTGSTTATEKFLTQTGVNLEKQLRATPEAGTLYDAAVQVTKESTAQFGARTLGPARLDPVVETLGQRFVKSGDAGAAAAADLAQSPPEVIAQTGEYLKALAAREGLDAKFIRKYEGFLNGFPDQALVTELRSSAVAESGLVQARQAITQVAKEEDKFRRGLTKTALADFASKPTKTMNNLLSKPDSADRLNELLKAIDDPAAARDAFRQSFTQRISRRVGGKNVVTQSAIDEFDRVYPALERLFADVPEELQRLQSVIERTAVENLRRSAPGQRFVEGIDELERLVASGAAATLMTTGNFAGTHALMVGGAIRRAMLKLITSTEGKLDANKMAVISDMVSQPEEFLRIMSQAPVQKGGTSAVERATGIFNAMLQPGFAGFVTGRDQGI